MKEDSYYAVLIGINEYEDKQQLPPLRYAEKDCKDLYQVLTDPNICGFPEKNIKLLLGKEAITRNVEEALYTYVVKDRKPDDMILVYFSGHGFIAGDQQLAYIGTHEILIKNLLSNPNRGLRMDRIHEDYFKASKAKHVLFILDCCHSGALTPSSIRSSKDLIDSHFFSSGTGRIAIFACPPDNVSRESPDLGNGGNGVFTYYIIRGLQGEAIEPETGEVTLDSLFGYVSNHTPVDQPPGRYGQSFGRIPLSKPKIKKKPELLKIDDDLTLPEVREEYQPKPLKNPLEPYINFADRLQSYLENCSQLSKDHVENRIVEAIRRASEADFVFVLRFKKEEKNIISQSEVTSDYTNQPDYIKRSIARAESVISRAIKNTTSQFDADSYYPYEGSKAFVVVPLYLDLDSKITEFMVVDGLKTDSYLLGDAYIQILSNLFCVTRQMISMQLENIQDAIIDGLKRSYGYVSLSTYNQRFTSFCNRLKLMDIYFEPILYLNPGRTHIRGWEALARDPSNMAAPTDLFTTAELWGDKFTTELDLYFLQKATQRYTEALEEARMQKHREKQDLSINVYPQSLMRTSYFNKVKSVLKETRLIPDQIFLEISEKAPIPKEAGNIESFKKRLSKYVNELKIGFSIDDFGVGHASVSRLLKLHPAHIKIDQEVLHIPDGDTIINFVVDVASRNQHLRASKVIIEGFENTNTLLTLNDLYRLKIEYVQGHIVGKAGKNLYRLSKEEVEYLESLIRGG